MAAPPAWTDRYEEKVRSPEEAIAHVQSGIAGFDAEILPDNLPAMKVLHKLGFPLETIVAQSNYPLRVRFERPREQTTT